MAGFPHHQLDSYLGKLIKQGFRVAVCDQVEDPKEAKGLVKREVRQILSPGTITDQALLDPAISNFLVAVCPPVQKKRKRSSKVDAAPERGIASKDQQSEQQVFGVSWADISTGQFFVTALAKTKLADLVARLNPSEILIPDHWEAPTELASDAMMTARPDWAFGEKSSVEILKKQLSVASLEGFGVTEFGPQAIGAAGAILDYLQENQKARWAADCWATG